MNIAELCHLPTSVVQERLRIAASTFRLHCADLRQNLSAEDFDFFPHDKAVSLRAYKYLESYIKLSKLLGKRKALEHLRINGIEE